MIDRVNIFNIILLTTFTVCQLGEIRLKSETRKSSVPIIYTAVILYYHTVADNHCTVFLTQSALYILSRLKSICTVYKILDLCFLYGFFTANGRVLFT